MVVENVASADGEVAARRTRGLVTVARVPATPAPALLAAVAALAVLADRSTGWVRDYGNGLVPAAVPWLSAGLSAALAATGPFARRAPSFVVPLATAGSVVLAAWSAVMLPFDLLRLARLVPPPVSGWGMALRLLLLAAAAGALAPWLADRRARLGRCGRCRRTLPGTFARVPRWPAAVGLVAALPYPALRTVWALGGTFGTAGAPLDVPPVLAWGVVVAGLALAAVAAVLLVGRGPRWVRGVLGLGGAVVGTALAVGGGLATVGMVRGLAAGDGVAMAGDSGVAPWAFLVVYGAWCVAGAGVVAGAWRYWVHRRDACAVCGPLLALPGV